MIKLSDRLQLIADLIDDNESVCDIGTDHGYLPIYLYEKNSQRKIVMSDVSAPSLEKCRMDCFSMHSEAQPDDFDLRLGSGLEVLEQGEVNCIVMAGMGGMLIQELMGKDPMLSHSIKRYILQPRRHVGRLRQWLEQNGYRITDEKLVRESRFIWPVIVAEPVKSSPGRDASGNSEDETYLPGTLIECDIIEYEYPESLVRFSNELTADYLKNALVMEQEKLESKKNGKNTLPEDIARQEARVSYLEKLIESNEIHGKTTK